MLYPCSEDWLRGQGQQGSGGGGVVRGTERREKAGVREMWADTSEAHTSGGLQAHLLGSFLCSTPLFFFSVLL